MPTKGEKSAYARTMERNRREAKKKRRRKVAPSKAMALEDGKCGAKSRSGKPCRQAAGHGTSHPGIGCCKYHGGGLPTHAASAAKKRAVFMGAPIEINPLDALMFCIRTTAGEVVWLTEQIQKIETDSEEKWYEHTVLGRQMHILVQERARAQDRLARYSSDAIRLGIAERAVRLAEQYGSTIARLLNAIREELQLNATQTKSWPQIVRKNLLAIETAKPVIDHEPLAEVSRRSK